MIRITPSVRSFALLTCFTLVLPTLARAEAPATKPVELNKLFEQLGSDDSKARDAATAEIVELGDEAVKPLEELAAKSQDPEVLQRVREIVAKIDKASVTKPSRVTLKFKKAPAKDVYESLYKQADAKLVTWPPNLFDEPLAAARGGAKTVTVDLENVPFWEAMVVLEEQTGLFVRDMGREMSLTESRMGDDVDLDNVYIDGPYMVVVDKTFGEGMIHQLKVFVEPRVRVLGHARQPKITEVENADGPVVAPVGRIARRMGRPMDFLPMGGNAFDVHLEEPLPRVGRLKGSVAARIVEREETIEFGDMANANNVTRVVGERRFMLNAMNPEPGDWLITVIVFDVNAMASGGASFEATLLDAKGNAYQRGGMGSSSNNRRADLRFDFRQPPNCGAPSTLKLVLPVEVREVEIPFEFEKNPRAVRRQKQAAGAGAVE